MRLTMITGNICRATTIAVLLAYYNSSLTPRARASAGKTNSPNLQRGNAPAATKTLAASDAELPVNQAHRLQRATATQTPSSNREINNAPCVSPMLYAGVQAWYRAISESEHVAPIRVHCGVVESTLNADQLLIRRIIFHFFPPP